MRTLPQRLTFFQLDKEDKKGRMGEEDKEGSHEVGKIILCVSELCFIEEYKIKSFHIQQYSEDVQ